MSNIYQFQTEDQMYEDANRWVARLDKGLTEEQTEALRRWLDVNPVHRDCLLEMAELWDRMDSLSVLSELFDPPVAQEQRPRAVGRTVWAVAASVLALVFAVNLLVSMSPGNTPAPEEPTLVNDETSNTLYETGIGAHSTVNLPDGTRMLLNTNTLVSVTYSADERLLVLKRGELHVEVAHDKQRPLRVQAGDQLVEAVGTAFNVYLKDDKSFDVIVTEGRVRVRPQQPEQTHPDLAYQARELTRGQKLSVRESQPSDIEEVNSTAINDRLSWREGNLVFRGETLRDALSELSRYTPATFKVVDPRISDVRVAGLYKAGDVDGLLLALKENFNIDYRHADGGVIELSLREAPDSRNPEG